MITSGALPAAQAVVIRAGDAVGRHVPVVGIVYRAGARPEHFAGAGETRGDVVHFGPEAWDVRPQTMAAAIDRAREKAAIREWAETALPERL